MSQVTEQSVRFQTALASIKLIQASAVLDLTEDDFDFLDRKSGSARMPRPISYAVFCLKKKNLPPPKPRRHDLLVKKAFDNHNLICIPSRLSILTPALNLRLPPRSS